jgi:hypothetical protein
VACGAGPSSHTLLPLLGAFFAPDFVSFTSFLLVVPEGSLERLLAEVAKFVYLLTGVTLVVSVLDYLKVVIRNFPSLARVYQAKVVAVLIALMSVEEHEHAEVSKVALTKSVLVQAMNLGVGKDVTHSLDVHYHQIPVGVLPGEVAEGLGNQGLVGVLLPPRIVVVLLILAWDVGLPVVVLVWGTLCGNLVYEGLNKLDEVLRVYLGDQSLVQLIDYELADEYRFQILLHLFQVVGLRRDLLRQLHHIAVAIGLVKGQKA